MAKATEDAWDKVVNALSELAQGYHSTRQNHMTAIRNAVGDSVATSTRLSTALNETTNRLRSDFDDLGARMERSGTFMDEQVNEEGKLQQGSTEASGIFARAASAVASSVDASAQAMDTELKAFENASSAIPVKLSG